MSIASADFNRDGTAGVVSGNLGTPPLTFCRVCVGDFDRDGRLDVLMLRTFERFVVTLRNTGGAGDSAGAVVYLPAAGGDAPQYRLRWGKQRGIAWW